MPAFPFPALCAVKFAGEENLYNLVLLCLMMQENTRGFTKGIDLRGTANVTTTQYKHSTGLSFDLTDPLDCLLIHFFLLGVLLPMITCVTVRSEGCSMEPAVVVVSNRLRKSLKRAQFCFKHLKSSHRKMIRFFSCWAI